MGRLEIADILPAMMLPDAVFFPHTILPIYIFESHYCEMLDDVIKGNRMFTILNMDPDLTIPTIRNLQECATLGCVKASQTYENGSSLVLLEGICRVEIVDFINDTVYPQVRIRSMDDEFPDPLQFKQLNQLKDETLQLLETINDHRGKCSEDIMVYLREIKLPQVFVDHVTVSFIKNDFDKMKILQTRDPLKRYSTLLNLLHKDLRKLELVNEIFRKQTFEQNQQN